MSAYPGTYSFPVYQGDTCSFELTYKEGESGSEVGKTLAGATVIAQIRTARGAASVTTTFTVTPDADQTNNPGKMTLTLTAANSALLTAASYVYDVEVTWADSTVQTILQGNITVTQDVSE